MLGFRTIIMSFEFSLLQQRLARQRHSIDRAESVQYPRNSTISARPTSETRLQGSPRAGWHARCVGKRTIGDVLSRLKICPHDLEHKPRFAGGVLPRSLWVTSSARTANRLWTSYFRPSQAIIPIVFLGTSVLNIAEVNSTGCRASRVLIEAV